MVKSPEQLKNMVEEYIKTSGVKYRDTTDKLKEKNADTAWQFVVGQSIHITLMNSRPDRIHLLDAIGFDDIIQKGLNEIAKNDPEFINSINEVIMLKGCTRTFTKKDKLITGINITSYIDSEALTRPKFYEEWDKLIALQNHLVRRISTKINPNQTKVTETDTSEKSMYG